MALLFLTLSKNTRCHRLLMRHVHHCRLFPREVNRLNQSGLVTVQNVGKARMVQAKVDNPVGQAMRQLILVTYGPVPVLRDTLQGVSNIEGAAIYGSWASRRSGVAGHVPNDIDVLVVGSLRVRSYMRLSMMLSRSLAMR